MTTSGAILTESGNDLDAESGQAILVDALPPPPPPAIGSQPDILSRLQQLLPQGWFAVGASPIKDAILAGSANMYAYIFSMFAYLKLQTRIATATDGFLDLISADFFGINLPRASGQTDASYKARIQAALFTEKGTRAAVIRVLTQLTGRVPVVFEPGRPLDTGALNNGTFALGIAGGLGSLSYPYQSFVTAFRPHGSGISGVAGLGAPGALNVGTLECVGAAQVGGINDGDIYAAIDGVKVCGTIPWSRVLS